MIRDSYKVLAADVILLFALYSVFQDLQWRTGYASSLHAACPQFCRYSTSFSYSVLTQFFTLAGNGIRLTSPLTLDWVQLLTYVLVILNAWYVYKTVKLRRLQPHSNPAQTLPS